MSYFKGHASQQGHGFGRGLGNILGGMLRGALPIVGKSLMTAAKSAGRSLLQSGVDALSSKTAALKPQYQHKLKRTHTRSKVKLHRRGGRRRLINQKGSGKNRRKRKIKRLGRAKHKRPVAPSVKKRYKRKKSRSASVSVPRKRRRTHGRNIFQ